MYVLENAKKNLTQESSYFLQRKTFFAACRLIIFLVTFIHMGDVIASSKISDAANSCCCIVWQLRCGCDSIPDGFCHEFQCFNGWPRKKLIFVCKPQLTVLIFFLRRYLSSKALRFFLMPVSVLGGKFREKKGINRLGVGLKKISKFHRKSFCHADFA